MTGAAELDIDAPEVPFDAYRGRADVRRVVFGPRVRAIGDGAFAFTGLSEVFLPKSVAYLGRGAFEGCADLLRAELPDCHVEPDAFRDCRALQSAALYRFPGRSAFEGCAALTSLDFAPGSPDVFSEGLVLRGDCVLYAMPSFSGELRVPRGVTRVAQEAFRDCAKITRVRLPGSLREIGEGAFMGCARLEAIELPRGVLRVPARCFRDCARLERIGGSFRETGDGAFEGCARLAGVAPWADLSSVGASAFSGCSDFREGALPEGLSAVRDGAFAGCGFGAVRVPDGVRYVGRDAFAGCGKLAFVSLPDTARTIRETAFYDCPNLRLSARRFPGGQIARFWETPPGAEDLTRKDRALDRETDSPVSALCRLLWPHALSADDAARLFTRAASADAPGTQALISALSPAARRLLPPPDLSRLPEGAVRAAIEKSLKTG